jgi:hypothetical protein
VSDPKPNIVAIDGQTRLALVALLRNEDPRLDNVTFQIAGPELQAESLIDAYLIDHLFREISELVARSRESATFGGWGELTFVRTPAGEIRVTLGGGGFPGGGRSWYCGFDAAEHQVAAFNESLQLEWRSQCTSAN